MQAALDSGLDYPKNDKTRPRLQQRIESEVQEIAVFPLDCRNNFGSYLASKRIGP